MQTTQSFTLHAKANKTDLELLLNVIKNTTTEAKIDFNPHGFTCRCMDHSRVFLVDAMLYEVGFESYESNTEGYITITNPESVYKAIQKLDEVIQIYADNEKWIIQDKKTKFKFSQSESEETDIPVPDLDYDAKIEILDPMTLIKAHKTISEFAEVISYEYDQGLTLKGIADNEEIEIKANDIVKLIDSKHDNVKQTYPLDYILRFFKSLGKDTQLELSYSELKPLRYRVKLTNGYVHFYLAPRIT